MNITTDVTWRRLRELIKKRDRSICFHCGQLAEDGHCDHLVPVSKGGTDSTMNLVWSCAKCNLNKGDDFISNDIWLKYKVIEDEQLTNYPSFKKVFYNLVWSTIKILIPPYTEYNPIEIGGYDVYFEIIDMERSTPLLSWLRNCIWPVSLNVQCVLDHLQAYDKLKSRVGKNDKVIENIGICPECNCGAVSQLIDKEFKWLCAAGHSGICKSTPGKQWLKRMREVGMMLAFDQTFPELKQNELPLPAWLADIEVKKSI